ncbi:MAG: hypothetical protein FJ030_18900 [Chloroflexi bacterium]|nr:hypothetical protein [Chloroflexota bacterium]
MNQLVHSLPKVRRFAPAILCFLILIASLLSGYAVVAQAQAQTRGLDLGAPINRPNNLYGVNVHLLEADNRDAQLAALKESGFGWVRQKFDWQNTDWVEADAVAESTRANGLGLVAVLTGSTPPDPVEFAAFAGGFAARYRDRIDHYQIWDEPNLEIGWSGPPSAAAYARVLQAAHAAIHTADPTATVMLAGLAPTVETGPKNISDVLYLRQLYELGARDFFDAVAGKPYGFNSSPSDRTVDTNTLNFSRLILLREEMIAHGDGGKFVWASNFGWNTRPSIWGQVSPEEQSRFTGEAFDRAASEWQWAGPMFLEMPSPKDGVDDPHRGFAVDMSSIVSLSSVLLPGAYESQSLTAYATFDGAWKFSDLGADIPQDSPASITLNFVGADLAVTVRRADYRAYLFVTIDGQPANALPKDSNGTAYVILTSPDLQPRLDTITLARGLAPGPHTAVVRAERGWDQWAVVSFTIGPNVSRPDIRLPLTMLIIVGMGSLFGLIYSISKLQTSNSKLQTSPLHAPPSTLHASLAFIASLLLWASAWLTWGSNTANEFRKYGDAAPLIATLLTAGLFYYSPFLILTLICLAVLFSLFYLRPDLALPLIAFFIPFYLLPRPLFDRAFSMVEICAVLAVAATVLRLLPHAVETLRQRVDSPQRRGEPRERRELKLTSLRPLRLCGEKLIFLDWAVIAFIAASALTLFIADVRGVAVREFRVVVIEPALFYLLLRALPLDEKRIWNIVDCFLIGAVVVALYGLSNLAAGQNLITAEGGAARIRSVFGSPNNLGLFLGRAIPIAAAVALLGNRLRRRILYGLALLPLLAAAALSFSRGALLLGIPASLAVILLFWGSRRAAMALTASGAVGVTALALLSRNPRFANLFDITSGTGFFRINLWRSALAMWTDHPMLGVGLDNFLYAYRGKYILPEAWQEPNLPHAHNFLLDALTRTGLIGLLAFLAILFAFSKIAFDLVRPNHPTTQPPNHLTPDLRALAIGLVASMINLAAHGMVDTGFWFVDLAFVFMMTMGLVTRMKRE